jgi:Flp pilus assembly protein TadG
MTPQVRSPRASRLSRQGRAGSAAVELAAVLPLLALLLLGIWEVGRLVEAQQLLSNAAREGGRQASTGTKTTAQVQQDVLNYLNNAGVNTTGATVTFTNLTDASRNDPTVAQQMDKLQITVTLPFNNVRWALVNQVVVRGTTLTGSATWYSVRDLPVNVSNVIPIQ